MEAQRFPEDFDGIIAGAPAYDWTGFAAQMLRNMQALFPDPKNLTPMFTPDALKGVESAIVAACDIIDGVKDGIIDDPRQCRFDVDTLSSLTPAQKKALKVIYAPTTNREGEIHPAQPFGGEGQTAGWPTWITGTQTPAAAGQAPSLRFAFGTGVYKYLVFNNPDWDYSTYDFNTWKTDTALAASFLNATDTNLQPFRNHGGKLILWHGWADPALTPLASIRYYEQVVARDPAAADAFRMFLLPGVLHCGGGLGPDTADWTAAIDNWVEHGQAPERVIATRTANGAAIMSRPLCPYPQKAVYSGAGSTNEAESFVCRR
jgi:feruloyl esterase